MPSLQQFASLWCNSCSAVILGFSSFKMESRSDSSPSMLTSSLPPVGMQKCGNCDSSEVSLIADTLLKNLCIIVVEKNARDPFGSAQVKAEEVRRSIMEHINRMSNDYFKKHVVSSQSEKSSDPVKPSATVEDMLESYVSGSRNLLTQLSTRIVLGDKKEEVVKQVYDDLEKLGFWVLAKREAVARVLIERVDTEKVAHCSELFTLDDEDAYSLHQEQCKFAPFECVNIGCGKVNSLMYAAAHDEVCPRKLVPCSQDCGLEIAREDMKTHTLTVCNKKPVPCPFKSIGCNEPLVQGELLEHCRTWVERHLFSTFTAHQEAVATVNDQGRQLSLMQKTLGEWQRKQDLELQTMRNLVDQSEHKFKELEAELKHVRKEIKGAQNGKEVAQLKKELASLKSEQKKSLESKPESPEKSLAAG